MSIKQVILVGHCGADSGSLRAMVGQAARGAQVVGVNDQAGLEKLLAHPALLLINRVLDGSFSASDGIDLIRLLGQRPHPPVMMLISNFAWAQQQAHAAGAVTGFGKSDLYSAETQQKLARALGLEAPPQAATA